MQLAARITDRAEPGQILVPDIVRQLCAGKTFEFTSVQDAMLKGSMSRWRSTRSISRDADAQLVASRVGVQALT